MIFTRNWQGDTSEAAPDGWAMDADGWYVRAAKPGDVTLDDNNHSYFGFDCEGKVFVRSASYARDYDRGVVTPWVRPFV